MLCGIRLSVCTNNILRLTCSSDREMSRTIRPFTKISAAFCSPLSALFAERKRFHLHYINVRYIMVMLAPHIMQRLV